MKDYALDLIALFTEQAKRGTSSCGTILDIMMTVPDEAISPTHFPVWAMVRDLAGMGSPPIIPSLRRKLPNMPGEYWVKLKSEEASIKDVRDALLDEVQRGRYVDFHGRLKDMLLRRLPFAEINEAMSNIVDESIAGIREASSLRDVSFMERMLAIQAGTVPMIETPWPQLNAALGGGLFVDGDLCMSGVLAYSGVGKTRWAQQLNVHVNGAGHWVLVFAGESNRYTYMQGLASLVSAMPKSRIRRGMKESDIRALREAEKTIQGFNTYVYDVNFDIAVIRAVMSRLAHKLKEARTAGTSPQSAQLLVIIDNIDHAVEGGGEQEWKELAAAAKALYNTAQRLKSHVIILSQAKPMSFFKGYAPSHADFARANLIASHCSNVIGLYRPLMQEQVEADDTRADPKFGLTKTRSGESNPMIPCSIDTDMGAWL